MLDLTKIQTIIVNYDLQQHKITIFFKSAYKFSSLISSKTYSSPLSRNVGLLVIFIEDTFMVMIFKPNVYIYI